jgi:hypothetical protein
MVILPLRCSIIFIKKKIMDKPRKLLDCNDPADQLAIANYHSIPQATFDGYMYNFWGAEADMVDPVIVPWEDLSTQMATSSCSTNCWKLEMDPQDANINAIAFSFQELLPDGKPPENTPGITYYSFALMNGAKLKDDADEYHFYKAQYPEAEGGRVAVIFQTVQSGTVLGYYNLSNEYPIELPG